MAEIKKLLVQIYHLQLRSDLKILYERVDKLQNLESLRKIIGKPTLENLILTKTSGETTESLDSYNQ